MIMIMIVGENSSVGTQTRYRLDRSGIEFRWGQDFLHPSTTAPGAHPDSFRMVNGSFQEIKRPRHGVSHPAPTSTKVKERVYLNLYYPSGPLWLALEWILHLSFYEYVHSSHKWKPKWGCNFKLYGYVWKYQVKGFSTRVNYTYYEIVQLFMCFYSLCIDGYTWQKTEVVHLQRLST